MSHPVADFRSYLLDRNERLAVAANRIDGLYPQTGCALVYPGADRQFIVPLGMPVFPADDHWLHRQSSNWQANRRVIYPR